MTDQKPEEPLTQEDVHPAADATDDELDEAQDMDVAEGMDVTAHKRPPAY